mgnify:FL=1
MKKLISLVFIIILTVGCHKIVEKPKNLVSQEKMTEVLVQIYLHQQPTYMNQIPSVEWNPTEKDIQIIQNHGLKVDDFTDSYRYYVVKPEIFSAILLEVRNDLENMLPEEERQKRVEVRESIKN